MSFPQPLVFLLCSLVLTVPALAAGKQTKGNKPLSISQGSEVALTDFLVTGKTTVFDFTSVYCPPCRAYAEPLLILHQQRGDLAVVKVDINRVEYHHIDWESPVSRQYGLPALGVPHFKIYGPDGKLVVEGREAREQVNRWLAEMR